MPWISLSIKEEKNERNMLENSLKALKKKANKKNLFL